MGQITNRLCVVEGCVETATVYDSRILTGWGEGSVALRVPLCARHQHSGKTYEMTWVGRTCVVVGCAKEGIGKPLNAPIANGSVIGALPLCHAHFVQVMRTASSAPAEQPGAQRCWAEHCTGEGTSSFSASVDNGSFDLRVQGWLCPEHQKAGGVRLSPPVVQGDYPLGPDTAQALAGIGAVLHEQLRVGRRHLETDQSALDLLRALVRTTQEQRGGR